MKILIVADTHGKLMQREINEILGGNVPDVVFILGDLSTDDIEALCDYQALKKVPMYGVVGNHDSSSLLTDNGITDIHLKTVTVGGYTVGGFGGSLRYKSGDYYLMHTNEESEELLSTLPPCDILLTHDKPHFVKIYHEEPEEDDDEKQSAFAKFVDRIKAIFMPVPPEDEEEQIEEVCKDKELHPHSGLTGIAKYIERCCPIYAFHGHLHDRSEERHGSTTVRCCYYLELIDI